MAQSKAAGDYRRWNQDISGFLSFTTAQTTATLVTARNANSIIYIQKIIVRILTDAAQSLTFQDSNGTPRTIGVVPISPGANSSFTFDFGDIGIALTEAKDFKATFSAAGLAGHFEYYGYTRLSSPVAPGTTN